VVWFLFGKGEAGIKREPTTGKKDPSSRTLFDDFRPKKKKSSYKHGERGHHTGEAQNATVRKEDIPCSLQKMPWGAKKGERGYQ